MLMYLTMYNSLVGLYLTTPHLGGRHALLGWIRYSLSSVFYGAEQL